MIDLDELRHLWVDRPDLTQRQIAAHFHTTTHVIAGILRRARKAEGSERWPNRPSPVKPSASVRSPPRVKPGHSTLPPLGSLDHGQ